MLASCFGAFFLYLLEVSLCLVESVPAHKAFSRVTSRLNCCFVCGRILLGLVDFALIRQLGMVTPRRVSLTLANPTLETT